MVNKDMTLEQWLDYWFENCSKRTLKRSTAISYRGYITNHIKPQIGLYTLSELNTEVLQDFFNFLHDKGNSNGGGLSPKTLQNIKRMLHKSLAKAYEMDIIKKNYAEFVELPKVNQGEMRVLTIEEQALLVTELKRSKERYAFAVTLSLNLGLRLGEVLGLRWCDIDFDKKIIHIRRTANRLNTIDENSKNKTELVIDTPKTQSSIRDVPINDFFCAELLNHHLYVSRIKKRVPQKDDLLFTNTKNDNPAEPKTVAEVFKRIAKNAGIEKAVNFHCLRHTFATRAIEKGIDAKTLSVLLGHASVDITVSLPYGHTYKSSQNSIITALCITEEQLLLIDKMICLRF